MTDEDSGDIDTSNEVDPDQSNVDDGLDLDERDSFSWGEDLKPVEINLFTKHVGPKTEDLELIHERKYLHINDNTNALAAGQDGYNPLFKIQPVNNTVKNACNTLFRLGAAFSFNEVMIPFKGSLWFRSTQRTVLSKRKHFPKDLEDQLQVNECKMRSVGNLVDTQWRHKRVMHMLSTDASPMMHTVSFHSKGGPIDKQIYQCVEVYIKNIGDVDRQDQVKAYFSTGQKK
ncbi:hypothetical protein RRG08_002373 [Elysia crispata]|uniref:PiggyBac transposable element-derived protein domain-containing protein n=1 Tax=Elysia crispata TaxID=231223 RepID=A0AAE1B5J1_9GAST|nr:hypothetical protein RRG08_002373 [Elysia crispata]